MNLAKLFRVLFTAVIASFVFAGTAWAGNTPTSPAGTTYEGKLHATSEGHVMIHNPIARIECAWTFEGEIKAGASGKPIDVPLSSLTFTGCTNSWHVTAISAGSLEIHAILGSTNGTVTWTGATIEATRLGTICRYKTSATDIGTLTGSKTTGSTATLHLGGKLSFHSGSGLCGENPTALTGSLSVGTPDYLDIDAAPGDTPTSPAGTTYEGKLHATSEGGHVDIANPIANIDCSSTMEGEVKRQGAGKPTIVPLSSLTFSSCTNAWTATVNSPGTLEIHSILGSKNGTVTWSGAKITFTRLTVNCIYETNATPLGTLTSSEATGATATIDISAKLPVGSGSSALCGTGPAAFAGSYKVGTPDYLDIDAAPGDTPTSPAGTTYEGKLHATSEGGHVVIANPIANIECSSTLEGEVKRQGAGKPTLVPLSSLTLTGCTNAWTATVNSPGTLEIHSILGSKSGTATWSGAKITFTRLTVNCIYETNATPLGTLTSSEATGATATIDISAKLPVGSGSSALCGTGTAAFAGSYKVGTPDYLDIDAAL